VPTGYAIEGTTPGTKSGTIAPPHAALQTLISVWDTLDDATVNRIMKLIQGQGAGILQNSDTRTSQVVAHVARKF